MPSMLFGKSTKISTQLIYLSGQYNHLKKYTVKQAICKVTIKPRCLFYNL